MMPASIVTMNSFRSGVVVPQASRITKVAMTVMDVFSDRANDCVIERFTRCWKSSLGSGFRRFSRIRSKITIVSFNE